MRLVREFLVALGDEESEFERRKDLAHGRSYDGVRVTNPFRH